MSGILDLTSTVNVVVQVARTGNVTGLCTLDVFAAVESGYVTWHRETNRYYTTDLGRLLLQRRDSFKQAEVPTYLFDEPKT